MLIRYITTKYTIVPLYLPRKYNNKNGIIIISPQEIYIINNLKVKILIKIDIIIPKKINILAL